MSRLGTKTYNRKNDCKTSIQFDHLLAEKGNKPSTAKVSVAGVHRWGMTSFTSLRKTHLNGQKDGPPSNVDTAVKRIKLESKIKPNAFADDPFSFETDLGIRSETSPVKIEKKPAPPKPNKFFKSGTLRNMSLVSSTNSSKKSDFDALRVSVSQNYCPLKEDEELSIKTSSKNGSPLVIEKSSRLFESLVQSKPIHMKSLQIRAATPNTLPFSHSDLERHKPVTYSERVSEQSLFLVDSNVKCDQVPLNELIHSVDSQYECNKGMDFSNSVISDFRPFKGNDFEHHALSRRGTLSDEMHSTDSLENIHSPDVEPRNTEVICDRISESSHTKPKFDTVVPKSEVASNASSSQSNSPTCMDKEQTYQAQTFSTNSDTLADDQQSKVKNSVRPKKIFNTSKKPKAVYNHRHWQSIKEEEDANSEKLSEKAASTISAEFDDFQNAEVMDSVLMREVKKCEPSREPVSSIKCFKPVKQLYTVVRNVKQAYQCHESGETQEFNDDIEYLLEGLQESNGIGTRCLSVLSLATKCMGAAFRVHLRAHGTMPKIFSALQDAPTDPNLSLCTATLLFVLSQDRLTMDIEASTLSLMLQLLETDPETGSPEKELALILEDPALCAMQDKHREKVYQLCEQMQQKGHAKHLKLDNINTGILAMETLLSLTSRKAGEWFKEEMRTLHGLDHIVDTITSCVESLIPEQTEVIFKPTECQVDKIRKVDRCLRVLENVTYMNFENQDYLLHYKNCLLINYCLSLMKLCKSHLLENQPTDIEAGTDEMPKHKPLSPVLYCLLSVLKVLLNITFENPLGCSQVGAQRGLMENVLMCILQVPKAVPIEKRFDLLVLSLGLMINLVEHCIENRKYFMEMYALGSYDTINDGYEILASEALVEVLMSRLDAARQSEEQADELLSSQEVKQATDKRDSENAASQAECLEETLMKTLQKAGKHMEHSIIAAYISLLLGCVIQNNQEYADLVRDHVPDGKFDMMIEVLKKFMSFVSLTGAVGNTGVKSIQRIIEVLSDS